MNENKKIKITIGIPTASDMLHRKFVQSLHCLQYPINTEIDINIVSGHQLPFARNRIVQHALKTNADYLFFIDADMIFPSDILIRLLKHDLDIVNALAFRRTKPHYPCIFNWNEIEKSYETVSYSTGLLSVDATGMPAILIKTDVFRKMKEIYPQNPWYYYRDNLFSSDLTFCENARKLRYKIMIDTDLKIGHIGEEIVVTEDFYLSHLSLEEKEKHNQRIRDFLKVDEKKNDPTIK